MNELQLPVAPPLPAEVRERALAKVLDEVEPPQRRRRGPFLAVAAAVVTTLAVTTSVALVGMGRDDLQPLQPPTPAESWPAGDGSAAAILARCANAVQQTGRQADYPPISEWRLDGTGPALEQSVIISDSFACRLDPTTVTVSPLLTATSKDVTLVAMGSHELLLLNPKNQMVEVGSMYGAAHLLGGPRPFPDDGPRDVHLIAFVAAYPQKIPDDVRIKVQDGPGAPIIYEGPLVGSPVDVVPPLVTYEDRLIPEPLSGPDTAALRSCMSLPESTHVAPERWTPLGRHEVAGHPKALVGKLGDVGVGFCLLEPPPGHIPALYRKFQGFALLPLERPGTSQFVNSGVPVGTTNEVMLRVPPGTVRVQMVMRPVGAPERNAECSVLTDIAMCTVLEPADRTTTSFTTFTSPDPAAAGSTIRFEWPR